jgi:hypothetical protein
MNGTSARGQTRLHLRPLRRIGAALAAIAVVGATLAATPSASATDPAGVTVASNPTQGDGSSSDTPLEYEVTIDCGELAGTESVSLTPFGEFGKYYQIIIKTVDCPDNPNFTTPTDANFTTELQGDVVTGPVAITPQGTAPTATFASPVFEPSATADTARVIFRTSAITVGDKGVTLMLSSFAGAGSGGGSSSPCVSSPAPLMSYTTPELWAVLCDGWERDTAGTVTLPAGFAGMALDHRLTLPSGVSSIEITTSGSMRYLAPGNPMDPPPNCGSVFDVDMTPISVTSTVTDATGTANCVITFGAATTAPTTVFIAGRVLVPEAGSYALTYALLDGSTTIDSLAYTIVGSGSSSGGGSAAAATTAADVATAVALSAAAGVEGTSSALMVRDGEVVPVSSSISAGAGPRGGVVLEAEGLKVTVASTVGARPGAGVVVPEGGAMECSLCGGFVPGSVVEVWVNSDPRLTAAVRIPDDASSGDCHQLAIPTGAPLDGGDPIEAGAHTLQLQMYTDDGFAVLSTGITIGGVSPASVPAGDGSLPISGPLGGMLVLLIGAAGLGLAAARRQVVSD